VKCSTSVEEIIEKVAAYSLSGYDIECRFAFEPDIWPVQIDPGQVSQVIRNLMDNCREAMPRGGVITLSAGNVVVVPGTGKPFLPLDEGSYVKITIQDGGLGILQENMGRIFDPYFTTKDRGNKKGMGLGLTIAHSIIRKHGGHIQLSSQPGTGTTVEVYLRRHEGSENKGENGLVGV
jgi:signal transduction histidine kinase